MSYFIDKEGSYNNNEHIYVRGLGKKIEVLPDKYNVTILKKDSNIVALDRNTNKIIAFCCRLPKDPSIKKSYRQIYWESKINNNYIIRISAIKPPIIEGKEGLPRAIIEDSYETKNNKRKRLEYEFSTEDKKIDLRSKMIRNIEEDNFNLKEENINLKSQICFLQIENSKLKEEMKKNAKIIYEIRKRIESPGL